MRGEIPLLFALLESPGVSVLGGGLGAAGPGTCSAMVGALRIPALPDLLWPYTTSSCTHRCRRDDSH